jgi:mRNA turnover protein 4
LVRRADLSHLEHPDSITWAVSLTKVSKKSTKEAFATLREEIHENVDKWNYVWVFGVDDMRNAPLKEVRKLWKE